MTTLVSALTCALVVALFLAARRLAARLGNPPWSSPVLVAALAVGGVVWATGLGVERFEAAALPLRLALAPAIVALGAVVHRNLGVLAEQPVPLLVAVTGGTAVGITSAVLLARALDLGPLLTQALATKTLSTPFAVAVAVRVGGPVPLAAALAVLTGVVGALIVLPLLKLAGFSGSAVSGISVGQSAHLVGTDLLTRRDGGAAAWSAVTMVLAGVLAALLLPALWPWLT